MGLNRVLQPSDLTTGRLRTDIKKEIDKLDYDKVPLLMLLMKIGKDAASQMKFNWLTKERRPDWGGIASYGGNWAAGAADDGTIVVTTGEGWMYSEGDIIKIPGTSDTNIYVQSVSTDTITGISYDNTATIDLSSGATGANTLLNISNAFSLGSGKGTLKSHQPDENFNYIQIIQDSYGTVKTLGHVEYDAGGNELKENEEDAWLSHQLKKEKALFFGQKHLAATGYMSSGGNLAQYQTGGILEALGGNTITGAVIEQTTCTYKEFSDWLAICTKYAKNPVVFCGETIYAGASWWLGERGLQTKQDETTLGIAVSNFKTIYGKTVQLIAHRDLLTNHYAGHAFCIDLADMKYKFLQGLDTHLEQEIQENDLKQIINEYRSWMGTYVGHPNRHGLMYNVGTIAA